MRRAPLLIPVRAQRWLAAVGLSALLHGGLLMGQPHDVRQASFAATVLQTRTIAAAPPVVAADATPVETSKPLPLPLPPRHQAAATPRSPAATLASITVPAAAELHYLLRQGGQEGTARLSWQPQADGGYQLSLTRELAGRALPTWRSEGETGAEGLAPSRYAQQRKGRDVSATNFRRDEGLISFSASAEQVALMPGVQDRLSGWLQIAGVIAAAPARYPPGSTLRLSVVGLRGEAREWVFEVHALEPVTVADGLSLSPPALHLRRAPLGMYDGGIELWLDPDRGYLPVRVLVGQLDERGWEILLAPESGQ
jgi:hypothetical protein